MRVLIGYDGSAASDTAIALAAAAVWPAGSVLRVVSVIEPIGPWAMVPPMGAIAIPPAIPAEVEAGIMADREAVAAGAAARLVGPGRTVEQAVIRGRPATVLVDEARRFRADLVIGGSRGHGAIVSLVLGSVSAEVVDHAPTPVLVARRPALGRVLFATDGSEHSTAAEMLLATWPVFERVPIRVVSVADVFEPWHLGVAPTMVREVADAYAQDLSLARTEHTRIADEAAARLRAAGRTAEAGMRVGHAAAEIIEEADDADADLIVIGSRGQTGLTRMVLGSVARNVLHGSSRSVLVVRHPAAG